MEAGVGAGVLGGRVLGGGVLGEPVGESVLGVGGGVLVSNSYKEQASKKGLDWEFC